MSDDKFFERLRADAGSLQHQPDPAMLTRLRARIRERVERPSVTALLAAWFRPLVAGFTAIALAAVIAVATIDSGDETTFAENAVEITMAGESYSVSD